MAREMPEVKRKLESGSLNLTNLSLAQKLFRRENLSLETKRRVIEQIENKSKRQVEIILANYSPEIFETKEKLIHLKDDKVHLQMTFARGLLEKLEKVKRLRGHKNPNMTYEELLNDMCDFILARLQPKTQNLSRPHDPRRRFVPAHLKALVWKAGSCQYMDPRTGHRCGSQHLLEVDHIIPFSRGGQTTAENLRLLCRAHNQMSRSNRE